MAEEAKRLKKVRGGKLGIFNRKCLMLNKLLNNGTDSQGLENSVKELQKEILRYKKNAGPITETDLALVLRNINMRIKNPFGKSRRY